MDHETLESLNQTKVVEARRLGVIAEASPEVATKYRKARADMVRYARVWMRDCGAFREAHFGAELGSSLRLLLEEAFEVGRHATAEVEHLREQWAKIDALHDQEAAAGAVVMLTPLVRCEAEDCGWHGDASEAQYTYRNVCPDGDSEGLACPKCEQQTITQEPPDQTARRSVRSARERANAVSQELAALEKEVGA